MAEPFVIIGGGLAAARAAETLRAEGAPGPVILLTAESHLPYLRPPLSKGYLSGQEQLANVFVQPESWYEDNDIEVRFGHAVTGLDPMQHMVDLDDGTRLHYAAALIATGSRARTLDLRGADLDGLLTLRTLEDSDRIKQVLAEASRIVIVGAGWIGLEVASAARQAGVAVTIVEPQDVPLEQVLGSTVGALFAALHAGNGVNLLTDTRVVEFMGESAKVTGVRLADHRIVPADAVVVGVGAVPNVEFAASSGLSIANGIVVDEGLAASAPDVFAAGDVANAFHPRLGRRIRVEHWDNAKHQGQAAALAMLGRRVSYDRLPFFYSDQYDVGLEYTGHAMPGSYDNVVIRGEPSEHRYMAFWLKGRHVLAGMTVNIWDARAQIESLIVTRAPVDPALLGDPAIPLGQVTTTAA